MPFAAGARVGPYEIVSILGRGGMGEVYRARDARLNRDVAVKVLQPAVADDADRLARFGREAQLLAALNHPNIAQLLGLEEADGHRALVMELVEGLTLADRLAAGALPLDEALPIARQIVEALEAAHAAGIVHRDLKPSNIKIREDGTVKVLDFGLAKALDRDGAAAPGTTTSPTISMHATAAGIILGTAAYMSPEQARGRSVDKRADIWAFGAVLYEMLTGRRAFDADDTSDTLALVLTKDPDWTALPESTPAAIRRLTRRCLERDPKRRVPDIAVARLEIDEAMATPSGDSSAIRRASDDDAPHRRWRWMLPFGAGAALAAATVGTAVWVLARPTPTARPVARFGINLPPEQPLAVSFNDRDLAVSPDGTHLVYTAGAQAQLMVRPFDRLDALPLAGITNARAPFISPDGQWVGFFDRLDEGIGTGAVVRGTLRKVPIAGGPPTAIAAITGASRGASWGPDNSIVFATNDPTTGLLRVAAGGGEAEVLTRPDSTKDERDHHHPSVLPGGRSVLFTIVTQGQSRVAVLDLRTGQWKTVIRSGRQAQYLETGHLIFMEGGALWAVPFDVSNLEVVGEPLPVVERIGRRDAATSFVVSRDGTLAYAPVSEGDDFSLVWVDRQGNEAPIAAPRRGYTQPRLSPDGTRIAVASNDSRGWGFWIWDLALQTLTPLPDGSVGTFSVWSPDGKYLVFNSAANGPASLARRAVDGTGGEQALTKAEHQQRPTAMSPDGRHVVFEQQTPANSMNLMVVTLEEGASPARTGTPRVSPLLDTDADERNASIAPDGRWVAYESNKSGVFQIYVRPFPNVGDAEYQISREGGRTPLWAPDGREVFFVNGSALMAAAVQLTPAFRAGTPITVFESPSLVLDGRVYVNNTGRTYDVSRDGQRFLMLKAGVEAGRRSSPAIIVVQNWTEELKQRVPVP